MCNIFPPPGVRLSPSKCGSVDGVKFVWNKGNSARRKGGCPKYKSVSQIKPNPLPWNKLACKMKQKARSGEEEADVQEAEADERRGNAPAGKDRRFCPRALKRRFGGSVSKLCKLKGMRRACPETCGVTKKAPKMRPTATCGMHANTVYIFCKGKPVKKWGIGPEGATRAKGNCNYAYRHSNNKKRWNFCKGEEEADVEAEAEAQEDVEAGRTLRINMAKWHCGRRKGEKAGNCKGHDCRWQCDRGHRGSAWCGSFKWNQRSRVCTLKSAPMPLCKYYARARTVYIYCRGKPVKKWGIGREGRSRATGNCNYAYRHRSQQKRWIKFCKGK